MNNSFFNVNVQNRNFYDYMILKLNYISIQFHNNILTRVWDDFLIDFLNWTSTDQQYDETANFSKFCQTY